VTAREIYFEHTVLGRVAKCVAIDPVTGVEATVTGPSSALSRDLEKLALRALERRLAKESGGADQR
jgi:hypothetical protein